MKKYIPAILFLFALNSYGQSNVLIGQYFQLMPVFAPGLTGANDYLDIRSGVRHQWVGYEGAPRTYFFSGTGAMSIGKTNPHKFNSVRVSDMSPYKTKGVKLGFGAYVFDDQVGEIRQLETMTAVAIHIPIANKMYLSLGISAGFYNTKLDLSGVYVLRPQNDDLYQDYIQNGARNNFLKMNSGLSLYTDRFYLSYSVLNLANVLINGNLYDVDYSSAMLHSILGGYRFALNSQFEIIPNAYIRYSEVLPFLFDAGTRVRYQQNLYIGMSYRNDRSIISMIGFTLNDMYNFGYSYEHKTMEYGSVDPNSHEIIIGIQLFNHNKYTPIW